jgi:D-glycero-alpha-D-manno-heptose-7-phosphate kinase
MMLSEDQARAHLVRGTLGVATPRDFSPSRFRRGNRLANSRLPTIDRLSTTDYNPPVSIRASAPTRIDLAGGTLDIWPLYLFHEGAQTLNAAINLRAHAEIRPRTDGRVRLESVDTHASLEVESWQELRHATTLPLLSKLAYFFRAANLTLQTRGESPAGAGIAGSSALNVAVCGALARWSGQHLDGESLLAIAQNVEAQVINVPTGLQDYRPAYYGGIAAVELTPRGVTRVALPIDPVELQRRIVLCYTGAPRNSGTNNWDITKRHIDRIRSATSDLRSALEQRDWTATARHIALEWEARKELAPGVTTPAVDALIAAAMSAGARAAKVCGAGGGGCLFCLAEPSEVPAVKTALASGGARILDYHIDTEGLIVQ